LVNPKKISENTTFTPPIMVYPSAWRREQKAGGDGVQRRRAQLRMPFCFTINFFPIMEIQFFPIFDDTEAPSYGLLIPGKLFRI
jgi:hypothetical protein